jgi:hypothetical protein
VETGVLNDRELHDGKDASAPEHKILKGFVSRPRHYNEFYSAVEEAKVNFAFEAEWVPKVIWSL